MRRTKRRIVKLVAAVLAIGVGAAPAATADAKYWSERAGDRPASTVEVSGDALPPECASWARWMSYQLAIYGITGAQADSYIAQRADYPCHRPITARSLFHAGDPS